MSTHYLPGLGHRTYNEGDAIPVDAVPRPVIDPETKMISQTDRGYEILDIPAEELMSKQDLVDLLDTRTNTVEERLARIERLLLNSLRF
jgi:hypothetical protein